MHRIFKHSGQVLDRIDTYVEAKYLSPDEIAAAEVAAALDVTVETVTVEHVADVPVVDATIPPSPPPLPKPIASLSRPEVAALPPNGNGPLATAKAILAKPDADITAGEIKTLVLLMARFILRKWVVEGWR